MPSAGKVWVTIEARDKTKTGIETTKKRFKSLGDAVQSISLGQVAALGGVTFAVQKAITAFADFDRQIREITTLLPQLTEQEFQELGDSVVDLSIEFGQSIEDMAKARYDAISAGFTSIADSAQLLEVASKLAVGGVSDVAKTTDVLTSVLNAYGLSADNAIEVSDILFETVRLGKTTIDQLASSFGTAAAVAPTLGVSIKELGAATATLTAQGLSTDESIVALQATMTALLKPSEDLQKALDRLGFESGKAAVEALGFTDALKLMTEGATETELAARFPNVRAMRAVFPLVGKAADKFSENLTALEGAAGSTETAFGKMADGVSLRFDQLKVRMEALSIEVGQTLLPIGEAVASIIETFTDLPTSLQTTTIALGGFTVAASILTPIISNLIQAGRSLIPVLTGIGSTLTTISLLKFGAFGAGIGAIIFLLGKLGRAGSSITTATIAMQEAAEAGKDLETSMNEAAGGVENLETQIKNLSITQLETRLRDLEQRKIEIGLGFIPTEEKVELPEIDFEPQEFEFGFSTAAIEGTTQAINIWEEETIEALNKVDQEIELVNNQLQALQQTASTPVPFIPLDLSGLQSIENELADLTKNITEETTDEYITAWIDAIEQRQQAEQESLEAYQDLRNEFLISDREREEENLIARLDAWNVNWRDLEAGQQIFNAGMTKINATFLSKEELQWRAFTDTISSHMINSIGGYAVAQLDKAFGDWYDRQRSDFAKLMIFILGEFTKTLAAMVAQAKAVKLSEYLLGLGSGGGFFGFLGKLLFHEGGIVKATGLQVGSIVRQKVKPETLITFTPKGADTVPAMLEPGEAVIPREIVEQHRILIEKLISGDTEEITALGLQTGDIVGQKIKPGTMITFAPQGMDTVPAMLEPGEAVIPKDTVEKYPSLIESLISGNIEKTLAPGFQTGTIINGERPAPVTSAPISIPIERAEIPASQPTSNTVNLNMTINAIDGESVQQFVSGAQFRQAMAEVINDGFLRMQVDGVNVEVKY
jgi:TP901 family phage tail tape measure protein